jgi:hypothetical protein
LITKKELLKQEKENPYEQEHNVLLSLAVVDLQSAKGSSRDVVGVIFIGLARVASRWKSFPEK